MGGELAHRPAAMADRVLLGGAELRVGALVARAGVVRDESRVVAKAAAAAPLAEQVALATGFEDMLGPGLIDQGDRADVGSAAVAGGGVDFAQQLVEVDLVAGPFAGVTGRVDARCPAKILGGDAGVVGNHDLAGCLAGGPRLDQRVGGEAVAVLRRHLEARRQRLQLHRGQQFLHLRQLVPVAGGEDQATRSCTSRRRAMPPSARPSRSSREARESGVRSAVACTSTRPPSPVMTTLASTSALESSM